MVRAVRMSQGLDHYWPHCSRGVSAIDDGRNPDPIALLQEAEEGHKEKGQLEYGLGE